LSDKFETISHIIGLLVLSLSQVAQKTVISLFQFGTIFLSVVKTFSKASGV
jgi:hypothetical protein